MSATLKAIEHHGWWVVLLAPRSKRPAGKHWQITSDLAAIASWLATGGNIGLYCGPESGVLVLDFDDLDAAREMLAAIGPLPITVLTGSGKWHVYLRHEEDMPSKILWKGRTVGEVQRGPNQQAAMPPSIHEKTGQPYQWLGDPCAPLSALPLEWRHYLLHGQIGAPSDDSRPDWAPFETKGLEDIEEPWSGPPPEEILQRARAVIKGARSYKGGIKGQCPGCVAEGHDRSRDNAIIFPDGRWGCAVAKDTEQESEHKRAIGAALGIVAPKIPEGEMPGGDAEFLRALDLKAERNL